MFTLLFKITNTSQLLLKNINKKFAIYKRGLCEEYYVYIYDFVLGKINKSITWLVYDYPI